MTWHSNNETITLTAALGSVLDRAQIEHVLPKIYNADRSKAAILTLPHAAARKIPAEALSKACERHFRGMKVFVDGLDLRTATGEDCPLSAESPLAKIALGIAETMIESGQGSFRVSAELSSNTVTIRTLRPFGPGE